jgi:septal ring factor EnvC (AmiA/AmiB activator)
MDLLWLAVLIQTVYFIVNRAYALIILFILLSLGLQLWKKTSVVYLLIPMLICQIVFFVWRQRLGNTRETFLFKKKKKKKKKEAAPSISSTGLASIKSENKQLKAENKDLDDENNDLKDENKDLEDENKDLKDENKDLEDENKDLQGKNNDLKDENDNLEGKIESTNDALSS